MNTEKIEEAQIITLDNITNKPSQTANDDEMVQIPYSKLKKIFEEVGDFRQKEALLKEVALEGLNAIGLLDPQTGKLKDTEGSSAITLIMRSLSDAGINVALLLMGNKSQVEKCEKHFGFLGKLSAIFKDYAK